MWSSEARRASTAVVWPKSHQPEIYDEIIVPDPHAVQHGRNPWGQLIRLNLLQSEAGKELYARVLSQAPDGFPYLPALFSFGTLA